jgi:hypothetical protein
MAKKIVHPPTHAEKSADPKLTFYTFGRDALVAPLLSVHNR